jgi:UDP-N-acetylmuramoyl-tripeptide--D-alanyl-D-alanine ligase
MNPLPLSQIAQFAGGSLSPGHGDLVVNKVSTDSRTLKPGELFVALRGENFDAHNFVEAVAKTGAAGAIVESNWNGQVPENFALVRAEDTLQAYQQLASNYRRSLSLRVVAITGSNGKTSTKILPQRFSPAVFVSRRQKEISIIMSAFRAQCWKPARRMKSRSGRSA